MMEEKKPLKQFIIPELDMKDFKILEAKPKRVRFYPNHIAIRSFSRCLVATEDEVIHTEQLFDSDERFTRNGIPYISMHFDNNEDYYAVSLHHAVILFRTRPEAAKFYKDLDYWFLEYLHDKESSWNPDKKEGESTKDID